MDGDGGVQRGQHQKRPAAPPPGEPPIQGQADQGGEQPHSLDGQATAEQQKGIGREQIQRHQHRGQRGQHRRRDARLPHHARTRQRRQSSGQAEQQREHQRAARRRLPGPDHRREDTGHQQQRADQEPVRQGAVLAERRQRRGGPGGGGRRHRGRHRGHQAGRQRRRLGRRPGRRRAAPGQKFVTAPLVLVRQVPGLLRVQPARHDPLRQLAQQVIDVRDRVDVRRLALRQRPVAGGAEQLGVRVGASALGTGLHRRRLLPTIVPRYCLLRRAGRPGSAKNTASSSTPPTLTGTEINARMNVAT